MTLLSGVFIYVLIWWVVLFAVLPWGVDIPENPEPGHASSAPAHPHLVGKLIATSLVSLVVWAGVYYVIANDLISFRN
jgi:predicted secreted protein